MKTRAPTPDDAPPSLVTADLQASAWELACLGAELMDRDISCLAAQLLALCGPLKPTSVAFTAPEHGSKHQLGIKYESGQPRRGDPMLPTVLAGLASNLTDDSLRVIQETHKTLWTLLCDISPQDLESIVPSSLSGTLGVFCQSSVEVPHSHSQHPGVLAC